MYTKPGQERPAGQFQLSSPLKKYYNHFKDGGKTYIDGYNAFALGIQIPHINQNVWLATLGFNIEHLRNANGSVNSVMAINQIQACEYTSGHTEKKARQRQALASLRWEQMLVELGLYWASHVDMEKVAIQSAEKNRYYPKAIPSLEEASEDYILELKAKRQRFRMRYDVTAKRMGFKKNEANDWELALS